MYYDDEAGNRVYTLQVRVSVYSGCALRPPPAAAGHRARPHTLTLATNPSTRTHNAHPPSNPSREPQKVGPDGTPTKSAHPARFSPDDKFSRERITVKRRFQLLPTQQPAPEL